MLSFKKFVVIIKILVGFKINAIHRNQGPVHQMR